MLLLTTTNLGNNNDASHKQPVPGTTNEAEKHKLFAAEDSTQSALA